MHEMTDDKSGGEMTITISPEDFSWLKKIELQSAIDGVDRSEAIRQILKIRGPFIGTIRVVIDYSQAEDNRTTATRTRR